MQPGVQAPAPAPATSVDAAADAEDVSAAPAASALDAWIALDLNARRASLDKEGRGIATRQDASAESRRALAAATRTFKKTRLAASATSTAIVPAPVGAEQPADGGPGEAAAATGADAARAFTALLKEYQAEVDALTTRAKAAEAAFLGLYKALYEVPDPVPDLKQAAADRITIAQLREEMRALRAEHSGLTERSAAAQGYENRIAELETQNMALNARASAETKKIVDQKQTEWMATHRQAVEAYELREQELMHQLSVANDSLRSQQAGVDALKQQRDNAAIKLEELKSSRAAGAEMLAEDSGRALSQVNELRRRCAQLEAQVAGASGEAPEDGAAYPLRALPPSGIASNAALSAELAARDVEVSQLKDQVAALEEVLSTKDVAKSAEFARLAASVREKDMKITEIAGMLEKLPSLEEYETMKRQFDALQAFQFNDDLIDVDDLSTVSSTIGPDHHQEMQDLESTDNSRQPRPSANLEKRLLGKLKMMENRLTALRVDASGKDSRIAELSSLICSLEERNDDQKSLIAKLEDGINAMTIDSTSTRVLKARLTTANRLGVEPDLGTADTETRALSIAGNGQGESNGGSAWDWGDQQQAAGLQKIIREEPTMLDIVAGQRDRFRARTLELEDENRKVIERLERLSADMDGLKNDNVRLYEKIQFLQSYNQSGPSRGPGVRDSSTPLPASSFTASSGSVVLGVEEDDGNNGFLNQYRSMYEDMMNPYALFNRRERHKRMSEMSAPERFTLRASQRALSTKTSRLVVFFYIIALHLFVFIVLGFSSSHCTDTDVVGKVVR
jgi:homeobox protein cut-like